MTTVLQARPHQFVNTPVIERLSKRALRYLQTGYSVHLKGPAGVGKTTLAMHLADLIGRPMMMLFGNNDIHRVAHSAVKAEDNLQQSWVETQLPLACREGFTLVYDEFNRARPEVNNVLLPALEEKLLLLPPEGRRQDYLRVSPHFRVIFTSNPEEYCGVHATPDALLDRLITLHLPEPDELTQQQILGQKIGLDTASSLLIVRLVHQFFRRVSLEALSSLRPGLMIAEICQQHDIQVSTADPDFRDVCRDILLSRAGHSISEANEILWTLFNQLDRTKISTSSIEVSSSAIEVSTAISTSSFGSSAPHPTKTSFLEPTSPLAATSDATAGELAIASPLTGQAARLTPHAVQPEDLIYAYLQTVNQACLSQIEQRLSLNQERIVNGLRVLIEQGHVNQHDLPGKSAIYQANIPTVY